MIYLMYHELETSGRAPCHAEPGYVRYVVREDEFRAQLEAIKCNRLRGLSVSEGLESGPAGECVVITFDDGCETDLTVAAPLLRAFDFQATFYLVTGYLGRPGYLSHHQARELGAMGFEIGCHSKTHPYLTTLGESELHAEIAEAKAELEHITGQSVHHFSCPGGRWSPRVAEAAAAAGYRSVATSRAGGNQPGDNAFRLSRVAVLRGMSPETLFRLACGQGLFAMRMHQGIRSAAQRVLGDAVYDRLRGALLSRWD